MPPGTLLVMDSHARSEVPPGSEDLEFPRDPATLASARRRVMAWAVRAGLDAGRADDLVLAVSEAATNAIVHSDGTLVHLRVRTEGPRVVVEISDDGVFRPAAAVQGGPEAGGRGLPLLLALVDEVTFAAGTERRPGTRVRLVKSADDPEP